MMEVGQSLPITFVIASLFALSSGWIFNKSVSLPVTADLDGDDQDPTSTILLAEQDKVLAHAREKASCLRPVSTQKSKDVVFSGVMMVGATALMILHIAASTVNPGYFDIIWATAWGYVALVAVVMKSSSSFRDMHISAFVFPYLAVVGTKTWINFTSVESCHLGLLFSCTAVDIFLALLLLFVPRFSPLVSLRNDTSLSSEAVRPPAPDTDASFISRAIFGFVTPHLWAHRSKGYTHSGVPGLDFGLRVAEQVSSFRSHSLTRRRLLWRLLFHLWPQVTWQLLIAVLSGVMAVGPSWSLQHLLGFLTRRWDVLHSADKTIQVPSWHQGLAWALGLFATSIIHAILNTHASWTGRLIQSRVRAILTAEIMGKVLRRSAVGLAPYSDHHVQADTEDNGGGETDKEQKVRSSDGRVMALLSVDVTPLAEQLGNLYNLFPMAEVQIMVSLYMLIMLVGWAAFAGLLVVVLLLPCQYYAGIALMQTNQDLLKFTDQRLDAQAEMLRSAHTIKLFAWEGSFRERLSKIRKRELDHILWCGIVDLLQMTSYFSSPVLSMAAIIIVHTMVLSRPLTAEVAFSMIGYMSILTDAMELFIQVPAALSAFVSLRRVESFLDEPDTEKYSLLQPHSTEIHKLAFTNRASFSHAPVNHNTRSFVLRDLDVSFPTGKLSIICGPVASGKSTLLQSLLGETRVIRGSVHAPITASSVAYVGQSPWLQGTTVQANILSDLPWNSERYATVVNACCLRGDLEQLPDGDQTRVGPRGVTLSGGQQARVSLARALYSPASIILLDDVLSALDAHTAKHVFLNALIGPISLGRTMILVTHNLPLTVRSAAYVVALDNGTIAGQGTPDQLVAQGFLKDEPSVEMEDHNHFSTTSSEVIKLDQYGSAPEEEAPVQIGSVSFRTYKQYFLSMSRRRPVRIGLLITVLAMSFSVRGSSVAANAWLKRWAESYSSTSSSNQSGTLLMQSVDTLVDDTHSWFYLRVYLMFSGLRILLDMVSLRASLQAGLNAARGLYDRVLSSILESPLQFFDKTPVGRIINVLSHDVEVVDRSLSFKLDYTLFLFFDAFAPMAVILFQIPSFSPFLVTTLVLYACIVRLYVRVSRDLRRLEASARSPLYTALSDVLSGLLTIRASGSTGQWFAKTLDMIDWANRTMVFQSMVNSWLQIFIALVASTLLLLLGLVFVLKESISAAQAGFLLSLSIDLNDRLMTLVRVGSSLEVDMTSVERMVDFLELPQEQYTGDVTPPAAWPAAGGSLEVQNFSVRYEPTAPWALDNVSLEIQPGHKTALCGVSGSGKSTLALSFLRGVEPNAGKIVLDNLDVSTVPLTTLRDRIAYVPQQSDLFVGTVRSNLDPLGQYEDPLIWDALVRCRLANARCLTGQHLRPASEDNLENAPEGRSGEEVDRAITSLNMHLEPGGSNLSHGQRQLLTLARGMIKLSQARWLLLDEPTAALDSATDKAIQASVHEITAHYRATVVAIAHRLNSIVTWDHCVVLDRGKVAEQGDPYILLTNSEGAFHQLAKRSGDFDTLLASAKEAHAQRMLGRVST